MRILLLMRGAPGCGKSTFIDNNGLRPYALSADEIRLQCQSSQQTIDGEEAISQNNEKTVWKMLFELLQIRMENGEFTVIDATNSKTEEMNRYKQLAESYRYRMYIVDFTDVPVDECKRRNASRVPLKRVPEVVIDKMYARFRTQKVPSRIKIIKPDELDTIWLRRFDFSQYRKVVHIGDIHGCYTALKQYFDENGGFEDDVFYIFVGDYIDRGIENAETMKFMFEVVQRKNILLLEGNHERWLWIYGNGGTGNSKEFELNTRKQLEEAHLDPKDFRAFYRKLGQCAWYTYGDKEIFVSHGGIASLPENLSKMATIQMIKGVGNYNDAEIVAETWMNRTKPNQFQIHGHRNKKDMPIRARDRVFNLEGKVEFGGDLRIVELSEEGFKEIAIKNKVFKELEVVKAQESVQSGSVADAVVELRKHKRDIVEKNFGHISSFNFTSNAFKSKHWNGNTIKARGLYIDVDKMKVAARGYEKFFNINERPECRFDMLQYTLTFPVTAYVKENGFLGLIAYDEYSNYKDNLLITTKSSITGEYAQWLREMIEERLSKEKRAELADYCRVNGVTVVVECVDQERDPHIIEYPHSEIYLLAVVKNELDFGQISYSELQELGEKLSLKVKEKAYILHNWQEFFDWYYEVTAEDYRWNYRLIEGFVLEDSKGFMTKLKLHYYNYWKHLRGVAAGTFRRGYIEGTGQLNDALSNEFYGFCQRLYNSVETREEREAFPRDIITLRKMFHEDKANLESL